MPKDFTWNLNDDKALGGAVPHLITDRKNTLTWYYEASDTAMQADAALPTEPLYATRAFTLYLSHSLECGTSSCLMLDIVSVTLKPPCSLASSFTTAIKIGSKEYGNNQIWLMKHIIMIQTHGDDSEIIAPFFSTNKHLWYLLHISQSNRKERGLNQHQQ